MVSLAKAWLSWRDIAFESAFAPRPRFSAELNGHWLYVDTDFGFSRAGMVSLELEPDFAGRDSDHRLVTQPNLGTLLPVSDRS